MVGVVVKVTEGLLEGQVLKTSSGFAYKSFTGVPFAKPPLGDLRFKDPVPIESWEGSYDASKEAKACAQYEVLFRRVYLGEEDCLYLNVFVPEGTKQDDKLPVMFWVHGGAYCKGSGNPDVYGPEYLIEHSVIVVTINYRVGALGFLCLDTPDAPGNAAMKDQFLALKWVHKNIKYFGGDAENLTIFGESAGGSSTHHLILSPLTDGLYSRVIMQSGTATCEWAIQDNHEAIAFKLGEILGMKTNDKSELIKFLKSVPVEHLVMGALSPELSDGIVPAFAPVIEKSIPNTIPFITKDPYEQMKTGDFKKIPIMAGFTSQEGAYVIHIKTELLALLKKDFNMENLLPNFKAFAPRRLRAKLSDEKLEIMANKIKGYYFPNENNFKEDYKTFTRDFAFVKDTDEMVKAYAKYVPTYYYMFSYEGTLNTFKHTSSIPYKGACHADELPYLFHVQFGQLMKKEDVVPTEKDTITIRRMTEMWTNFAKYGNPTPAPTETVPINWEPIAENGKIVNCLDIGENLVMIKDPLKETVQFWNGIDNV